MAHSRPTIERRQLGSELRRLRVAAGKSQKEAAEVIECDTSLISRVERGLRALKVMELDALLNFYEAPPEQRTEIADISQVARQRLRRRMYSDSFPGGFRRVGDHEQEATEIYYWEPEVVPGLLQTETYARALISIAREAVMDDPSDDVELRVRFRLERQELLIGRDDPPLLWFVIGEPALRRPIGRHDVLADQLEHLLTACDRKNVVIQVAPMSIVDHPLLGGSIGIFRFDGRVPDIAHQATFIGGGVYMDDEGDVAACSRAFDRLRAVALGPEESKDFIAKCLKEIAE
ncbi:helix-turn-helix domain-containing protein [Saccharopolyspora indica]|uniref:helix-turn-helix domain-containing protein n=1 Tax=Saccharopolyspora indica TaxID=1229659 RepID=UPI0022EA2A4A|nr:helix-turn-helix transcriptional regulator [Saccharopolyspora indica]MDA3649041.1 helix-turn-helix transcriptional regulator [Saccharopolyspora indica]